MRLSAGHSKTSLNMSLAAKTPWFSCPLAAAKACATKFPPLLGKMHGLGITIVVSPLIALMHDQVGALHEAGVNAAFLNSTLNNTEAQDVEQRLRRGDITLLYAAPERITTPRFLALLDSLYAQNFFKFVCH
jgi:ATP-dependent DNA helicase RecQ